MQLTIFTIFIWKKRKENQLWCKENFVCWGGIASSQLCSTVRMCCFTIFAQSIEPLCVAFALLKGLVSFADRIVK